METQTQVEEVSPIETALASQNITNQVIAKLKADYLGLTIKGIDDKVGFKAVEDARKECKSIRVLAEKICKSGRENAVKIQKDWIAKEKEVVSEISIVEDSLSAESERIKEIEKQILFEAAQMVKMPIRMAKLATIDVIVDAPELIKINDDQFNALFNEFNEKYLTGVAEKLRIEKDNIAKEEAKKAELARIEAENNRIREEARLKAENEKLLAEKEKADKILAEQKAKADAELAKVEALRKIEQDKSDALLEKQRKDAKDNADKLKAESDLKLKLEREANDKLKAELQAKADAELAKVEALRKMEQDKADALLEKQRKDAKDKADKLKAESDLKLKAEREANAKLQKELSDKADAERKAEEAKQAEIKAKAIAEKKLKSAPDKEKLLSFAKQIELLECDVDSEEARLIWHDVAVLLCKVSKFINEKTLAL